MITVTYSGDKSECNVSIRGPIAEEPLPRILPSVGLVNVLVSSYGGDFFFGRELHDWLSQQKALKRCVVQIAASAATIPVMACDEIIMSPASIMMIHGVTMDGVSVNEHNGESIVSQIQQLNDYLASLYSSRTNGKTSTDEFRDLMRRESFLTAGRMIDLGFPVSEKQISLYFGDYVDCFDRGALTTNVKPIKELYADRFFDLF